MFGVSGVGFEYPPAVEIIDGVFLGSVSDLNAQQLYSKLRIDLILNCAAELPPLEWWFKPGSKWLKLPDSPEFNADNVVPLIRTIDFGAEFIHRARMDNKRVLVHCVAGFNRSPTVVIRYLMKYHAMSFADAYKFILDKRKIEPHPCYQMLLMTSPI